SQGASVPQTAPRDFSQVEPSALPTRTVEQPKFTSPSPPNEPPTSFEAVRSVPAPAQPNRAKPVTKKKKRKTASKRKYAHAVAAPSTGGNAANFAFTVQRKDRTVYFAGLLNGDVENYFGSVLSSSAINQTLTIPNPDTNSGGVAHLQIALQGASSSNHTIDVQFNGVAIGTMTFFGLDRTIQTFDLPVSQLLTGVNTVRLQRTSSSDLSLVDYIQLTYPHRYSADNGSLRFSVPAGQSARIDGFSTPDIRLLDYTDPTSLRVTRSLVE